MLRSRFVPVLCASLIIPALAAADDPKTPQEKLEAQVKQLEQKVTTAQNDIASLKEKIKSLEKTSVTFGMLNEMNDKIDALRLEPLKEPVQGCDRHLARG